MDSELRKLLKRNLEISKENNEMLHRLQSAMRWGRFFRIAYWVVIISLMFGAYYFIQPLVEQFGGDLSRGIENVKEVTNVIPSVENLLQGDTN